MFCTHCGTQIDEGAHFCKKCGAKLGHAGEPIPPNPMAELHPMPAQTVSPAPQQIPPAPPRENRGMNRSLAVAAGVAVIILGGAAVYFGTDMLRPPTKQETAVIPPPAARPMEMVAASIQEGKSANEVSDSNLSSAPRSAPTEPPPAVEAPRPPVEVLSKPVPAAPSVASRGGATPGTYETLRNTTVYDAPSASSKVVANIESGIRVSVVGSSGEWLEVHSKRGNPPGFIRRGDANLVQTSN